MNWLTNFVLPKIRKVVAKREVPGDLWQKCAGCEEMLFHRELEANQQVCHHCGHHLRLGAVKRLDLLFDDGAYSRVELPHAPVDPLRFRDRKRYTERLREAQAANAADDAVVVAHGTVGGSPAVISAFDFAFMG